MLCIWSGVLDWPSLCSVAQALINLRFTAILTSRFAPLRKLCFLLVRTTNLCLGHSSLAKLREVSLVVKPTSSLVQILTSPSNKKGTHKGYLFFIGREYWIDVAMLRRCVTSALRHRRSSARLIFLVEPTSPLVRMNLLHFNHNKNHPQGVAFIMVGSIGFEPTASCSQSKRSTRLS